MMEGLDISTSPGANAGAPFTGGGSSDNGNNSEVTTVKSNLYHDISQMFVSGDKSLLEGLPEEMSQEMLQMSEEQEKTLDQFLTDFSTSEEDEDFAGMIKNLLG